MRRSGKVISFLALLLALIIPLAVVSQELWSEVSLNKSSVYVGEPVEVSISVYTSTWFTRGIDPGNIKVNGAFTVYFRPVSTSFQKNGKNYAGVKLIYNVFPYTEKDIVFPSLDIRVETPAEGDFKGVARVVKSKERNIRVKPIPPGFNQEGWLVTTGMSVYDNWTSDLKNVKVGDVLSRNIRREAQGTVSELIPPVQWDSIPGVSPYPSRSTVENNQSKTAISAVRKETMRYLFEKEGEVQLPEMVFTWYNPVQQKLYKRTLKAIVIQVQPNPDLGMLASIRDSLQVEQALAMQDAEKDKPFTILGFSLEQFGGMVLAIVIILYVLVFLGKRLVKRIRENRKRYRHSEAFYFDRFVHLARAKKPGEALNALYRWIDELHLAEPSLDHFAEKFGSESLQKEVLKVQIPESRINSSLSFNIPEWSKARKKYLIKGSVRDEKLQPYWINPV